MQPALKANPTGKKKASEWPKWDGRKETYKGYICRLRTKIEVDWDYLDYLGGHRAVCIDMMNTLPIDLQLRVSHWFQKGGLERNWNYELFFEHFNENFEDKQAARAAGEDQARMRQGAHQLFADFLRDYEYKLAQADGLEWHDKAKINGINIGLNHRLQKSLVSVSGLSSSSYPL